MNFKSILACAALLIGVGIATAEVASDVVGYIKRTIEPDMWTLMAVNFVDLEEGDVDNVPLFSMISGNFAHDDEIQVPSGTGGYYRARWNNTVKAWCTISGRTGEVTTNPSTLTLPVGTGFWLKTSATDLSVAGKVYAGEDVTVNIGQQYKIFAAALPETISINSDSLTWNGFAHEDEIQVPSGTGGYYRARWNNTVKAWCTISGRTGEVTTTPSTLTVVPGGSFWVISKSAESSVTVKSALK